MRYKLKHAVAGEIPILGHRHAFDFAANRTTPQSEQDEAVFEHLVSIGMAERVTESKEDEAIAAAVPPPEPIKTEEEA